MMKQLTIPLPPPTPYSLRYFVPHSGVADAYQHLERCIADVLGASVAFHIVVLYGARGTGKTHLIRGFSEKAAACGGENPEPGAVTQGDSRIAAFDLRELVRGDSEDESRVAAFVSQYEQRKREGGLVLVEAAALPSAPGEMNPHLKSRLFAGSQVGLSYPREDELRPLLLSLCERKNLKLNAQSVDYLLRRIPLNPLSFDNILSAVSDFSLSEGRPAGRGLIQEVVAELLEK